MAARFTAKRKAAYSRALSIAPRRGWQFREMDNATLYKFLEDNGYCWHPDEKKWLHFPYIRSVFLSPANGPSGAFGIRVRAHPENAETVLDWLCQSAFDYGIRLTEVGPPTADDNGVSVRVYISGVVPAKKGETE